jgi:hypothetical protein
MVERRAVCLDPCHRIKGGGLYAATQDYCS